MFDYILALVKYIRWNKVSYKIQYKPKARKYKKKTKKSLN